MNRLRRLSSALFGRRPFSTPIRRRPLALRALLAVSIAVPLVAGAEELPGRLSEFRDPSGFGTYRAARAAAPAPARAQAGAVDPLTYVLGPGDGLTLHLVGPLSEEITFEVGPDGRSFLRDLGTVTLAGLTLDRARTLLAQRVAAHYRGVRAEITLDHLRAMTIYLTGEVKGTGPLAVAGGSRLADALSDTVFTPNASHRNIVIRHRDGTAVIADLGRFSLTGRENAASWLRDGDVVVVPKASQFVGVFGGVVREGRLELGPDDSLSTLLELAGGAAPSALRDRALFTQWDAQGRRDSTWIALDDIASGRANPRLRDGDNLFVFYRPEFHETQRVFVLGQVMRAGQYPLVAGQTRMSDIIEAAGGFGPDPDLSSIRLIRRRPAKPENDAEFTRLSQLSREEMTESEYAAFRSRLASLTPDFRIDWNRVSQGDKELDPLLVDGDYVQVDRISRTVRVDGQVRYPGVFEFTLGHEAQDYIRLAGGFTNRSARRKVRVTRAANGQSVLARNVPSLAPGDFIWVPENSDVTLWQRFGTLISVAAQAATIYLVFKR